MAYDTVIVRYGEIFLKSDYVRKRFEDILVENIRKRLKSSSLEGRVYKKRFRIYVKTDDAEAVSEALKTVFGIVSVSSAKETKAVMEDMAEASLDLASKMLKEGDSFAVRVERSGKHPYRSMDVEALVGEKIIDRFGTRVDLDDPDKTIYIEVRDDAAFVFGSKVKAVGGMPYRSQKGLVSLLSSGIDSPVASWMMMRRGCSVTLLHFGDLEEVSTVAERLDVLAGERLRLYCVPYQEMLKAVSAEAGKYTCILCKRFMYKVAEKVAMREDAYGLVTGENIGQVASQTLENLKLIGCISLPVYRPLVAYDKDEIIKVAREIGTFELAKTKRCPFVPDKPATAGELEKVSWLEEKIGMEKLVEDAFKGIVFKKG